MNRRGSSGLTPEPARWRSARRGLSSCVAPQPRMSWRLRTSARSTEFLVKDFYTKALEAKSGLCGADRDPETRAVGCGSACEGAVGASSRRGDVAPAPEDFDFQWPAGTFRSEKEIVATGTAVLRALLGAYQTAAALGL